MKNTRFWLVIPRLFSIIALTQILLFTAGPAQSANPGTGIRAALIQDILDQWRDTNEVTSAPRWEQGLQAWLEKLSNEELEAALAAESYAALTAMLRSRDQGVGANPAPPLLAIGQLYYPLDPCRIVDTRLGTGIYQGPVVGGTTSSFHTKDAVQIELQGGNTGGCGVPATATALVLNITAAQQAGNGFLTAFPADAPRPLASILNFSSAHAIANSTILPVCTSVCTFDLSIYASTTTQVIVDVMGYFDD